MAIFLDTGFFLGLVDPNDEFYDRSADLLKLLKSGKYGQIFTSTYVIAETCTLVSIRTKNNPIALKEINDLLKGDKQIASVLRPNDQLESDTMNLFIKINERSKKRPVSFVDCSNIVFCKNRGIDNILTYDKHFDGWLTRLY